MLLPSKIKSILQKQSRHAERIHKCDLLNKKVARKMNRLERTGNVPRTTLEPSELPRLLLSSSKEALEWSRSDHCFYEPEGLEC